MWTDPEVTRFIGGRPSTREDVWARLLRYLGHWDVFGYGFWIVVDRATGAHVGEAGFADFHREIDPPLPAPEMGWAFRTDRRGQGVASEVVASALAWRDAHIAARGTVCIIDPGNLASRRVAARNGFRELGPRAYRGADTIVCERP